MYKKASQISYTSRNIKSNDTISEEIPGAPLFVSSFVPWDKELLTIGLAQRFLVMLEAVHRQWGAVNVILLSSDANADSMESKNQAINLLRQASHLTTNIKILKTEPAQKAFSSAIATLANYFRPDSPPFTISKHSLRELRTSVTRIKPKAIFAHRLITFRALRMAGVAQEYPMYLDLDDIEHIARYRAVTTPPFYRTKILGVWHCLPLALEERAAGKICKKVLVCSSLDLIKIRRLQSLGNYLVTPNSIAMPFNKIKDTKPSNKIEVLFVGALTYSPNIAGLQWFLNKVWAKVLESRPNARLIIAGKGGENVNIPREVQSTVETLGYVHDISHLYERAAISICPLLSGGGTRIKIIESAAHGVPTVSTTIGTEGLSFRDGDSILIRDSPADFSAAVANLLANQELRQKISINSKKVFMEKYERNSVIENLSKSLALI
jgi:glycosyltransferase involved in cell wall biosynthesis